MKVYKTFTFSTPTCQQRVVVAESLDCDQGSTFTWPCAIVLATYLMSLGSNVLKEKTVVELGAGTGLPSLVAALLGAKCVTITDRAEEPEMYQLLEESIRLNRVSNTCHCMELDWNRSTSHHFASDIILGADVLYNEEDFDSVLGLISVLLDSRDDAEALLTYQHRW